MRKYLPYNQYGLNPKYAEDITSSIPNSKYIEELEKFNITLKVETGFIMGEVDEYDKEYPIKDTIKIYMNNELLGRICINSSELLLEPKYLLTKADFIQVTFLTFMSHPYISYFIREQLPFATNNIGENFYNFLILHESDVENGANIILSKLLEKVKLAKELYMHDKDEFITNIRSKYSKYNT